MAMKLLASSESQRASLKTAGPALWRRGFQRMPVLLQGHPRAVRHCLDALSCTHAMDPNDNFGRAPRQHCLRNLAEVQLRATPRAVFVLRHTNRMPRRAAIL